MQVQATQARAQLAFLKGDIAQLTKEIATMNLQLGNAQAQLNRQTISANASSAAINRNTAAATRNAAANAKAASGVRAWVAAQTAGLKATSYLGNQIQWAGRQLQYNFTLPLLIAGGAAFKWAMDQEAGMVRIKKVYGDGARNADFYKKEIISLGKAFSFLSEKYGIQKKDVESIAADWAAAGASGLALAKQTDLTMKTMILGEMDAASATKALISIQSQYHQSTKELATTINTLNMIENQTGITMSGLIEGFSRSAGVAKDAGVDVQHLGAMLAALTPAAGSATQAGNGLKTIISRLLSPTKEAAEVMGLMHVNTKSVAWQSKNAVQRLEAMAQSYSHLNNNEKFALNTALASRYQLNRLDVLFGDMIKTQGYYQRALRATNDLEKNRIQAEYELNQVLDSSPQKLKMIYSILQNAMVDIIQPLIPVILRLAYWISDLAKKFSELPPHTRDTILALGLLLAAIGPLGRYIGSFMTLLTVLGSGFRLLLIPIKAVGSILAWLFLGPFKLIGAAVSGAIKALMAFRFAMIGRAFAGLGPLLGRLLLGPVGWALGAVALLFALFHKQIAQLWNKFLIWLNSDSAAGLRNFVQNVSKFFDSMVKQVLKAFYSLPQGVQDAIMAVVRIVEAGAKLVYKLFSYLNPWAHHSPSLVESVTTGMAAVRAAYASIGNVAGPFGRAAADLAAFKRVAASLDNAKMNEQQVNVAKGAPAQLALFKSLRADLSSLNTLLERQAADVSLQQSIVDRWKASLDAANRALDAQQAKLDDLQNTLDGLKDAYSAHEDALNKFASTPIQGMQAMSDAIFENQMAQKKLQLQMAQWEQVNGPIEDTRNKIASLQGDIEQLTGEAANLRAKGAGSDILGPINAQIDAMKAQQKALNKAVDGSPIDDMQKQLDKLQKQGEILQLQNDIKFDPLTRQIDKLAKAEKELPYATIVAGIKNEQAAMAKLQPQIDKMTRAVAAQKAVVDAHTKARDQLQLRYDMENDKLQVLQDAYSKTEQMVQDIKSALDDLGSAAVDAMQKAEDAAKKTKKAADDAAKALSTAAANFNAAAGVPDFPDVSGTGSIGREGGLADQQKQIDQWLKDQQAKWKTSFGNFDIFKPIKDQWNSLWTWMNKNVSTPISNWWDSVKKSFRHWLFDTFNLGDPEAQVYIGNGATTLAKSTGQALREAFAKIGNPVVDWWNNNVTPLWNVISPDINRIIDEIGKIPRKLRERIGPELAKFSQIFAGMQGSMEGFKTFVKGWFAALYGTAFMSLTMIFSIVSHTIGAIIDMAIGTFQGFLITIRGILEVIVGLFTGNWGKVYIGLKDIMRGIVTMALSTWQNLKKVLLGIVLGIVDGIHRLWLWLKDKLVGHSVIPDLVNDIIRWFSELPGKAGKWISDFVTKAVKLFSELPGKAFTALDTLKSKLSSAAGTAFDWFLDRAKVKWKTINDWFGGRPQAAFDTLIKIKDKVGDVASKSFDNFMTNGKKKWNDTLTWFRGLPKSSYDNLIGIRDKVGEVGSKAFDWFVTKAKDIIGRDSKHGFMYWISQIPNRIASALGSLGSTIAYKLKDGWNSAAGWINKHGVDNVNKALKLFSVRIDPLPTFATGGVIPGKATRKDNTIIAARSGEGVIVPEVVRWLGGAQGLAMLNGAAQRGQLRRSKDDVPHFKDGGVVGKLGDMLSGIGSHVNDWLSKGTGFALDHILSPFEPAMRTLFPGKPFIEDWFVGVIKEWRKKAKAWGDNKDSALASGGFGGGGDFGAGSANAKANQAIAQRLLPSYGWSAGQMNPLIALWNGESGWNERARNPSSGAYGIPQSLPANKMASAGADWMTNPATQIRWGMGYIKSVYSTPANAYLKWLARSPHWYDKGGIMSPGLTLARNGTGKDELVLTNADATAISNVISMMDRAMAKSGSGGTPGTATVRSMSASVTSLESRLRAQQSSTPARSSEGTTININGDLVLPNIKSGNDADTFIKHLKNLAG